MSTIELLRSEDIARTSGEVRSLIAASQTVPNRFLASSQSDIVSLFLSDTADSFANAGGAAWALRIRGKIAGLLVVAELPWDTAVLGKRMAAVKALFVDKTLDAKDALADRMLDRAMEWAAERNTQFLLCKVFVDDRTAAGALERAGFRLVETLLNYVYQCRKGPIDRDSSADCTIRTAEKSDVPALVEVARAAFETHVGRFHSDPNLKPEEAVRIYGEWIRSSCSGYGDAVFVAESGAEIAGFSVWRDPSRRELDAGVRSAHYSIGAVHPRFRNRGVFRALTLAGMRRYDGQADVIEGPTNERNVFVQRAYDRLGWTLRDRQHTFHRWL